MSAKMNVQATKAVVIVKKVLHVSVFGLPAPSAGPVIPTTGRIFPRGSR